MIKTAIKHRINSYRNPVYIVYIFLGISIFLFGQLFVASGVGNLELYFFRFFNGLPGFLEPVFILISFFGTIGFVFVATIIALIRKHYSHAIKFLLAGVGAWLVTKWLKSFEYRARPSEILNNVQLRENLDSVIGYPSGHAAVSTAIGVIAYMYTPKRLHPVITWTIILVCLSRLYLGMHLPVDVIGGFGVGLAIASLINYIFGDTQGKYVPTSLIKKKMSSLKIKIKHIERAKVDARGSTPFFVSTIDGPNIFVKVVDKSNNVADWLFKLSRKVLYRRLEDEAPFLTPKRQLEHEAYVAGLALSNGSRTPKIRGIFHIKEDMWAMAQEMIDGKSLDKIESSRINTKMLENIWTQVKQLHDSNIIHRDLRTANIFIDSKDRPWIIDFGFSEASVSKETFYRDTVELIASLSAIYNPKDVVSTAKKIIGKKELEMAYPYLDYASLSGATTKLLKGQKGKLQEIKDILFVEMGQKPLPKIKVKRIDVKALLYIVMIGLALYALVPQFGDLQSSIDTLEKANINYIAWAFGLSIATYFSAAAVYKFLSYLPIDYFKTLLITVSTSFTNRLLPASTGAIATNIRYFQKVGYSTTQASSITALNNLVGLLGHIAILFVVAGLSGSSFRSIVKIPVSRTVIIFAVLVVSSLIIGVLATPRLRRKAKKIYLSVKEDLTKLFEHPDRFFFALFSAMTITTFYALSLYASALALGVEISVLQAFFVFTIGATAASVTPTPGGIGGAEAGLVAGFVSVGIPADIGLSVSLLFRLITFWIPIIPGFIAFNIATKKNIL
jgi:uncharacterized protein (TIRG00374 family)